jgi:hypothetical protein
MNLNDPNIWMALSAVATALVAAVAWVATTVARLHSAINREFRTLQNEFLKELSSATERFDLCVQRIYDKIDHVKGSYTQKDEHASLREDVRDLADRVDRLAIRS